ncbi:uncharacterized protein DFL_006392 [Arthrobotrys flagrans]|uniref:Uncharacterized protein n=1 Tax=Arthrobotrys flagrans TaxID=97331 RepID=A0A437A097_ARTFL|nr:hypothetical protein DFL_006392 [Arthrobotrys flagrans]
MLMKNAAFTSGFCAWSESNTISNFFHKAAWRWLCYVDEYAHEIGTSASPNGVAEGPCRWADAEGLHT